MSQLLLSGAPFTNMVQHKSPHGQVNTSIIRYGLKLPSKCWRLSYYTHALLSIRILISMPGLELNHTVKGTPVGQVHVIVFQPPDPKFLCFSGNSHNYQLPILGNLPTAAPPPPLYVVILWWNSRRRHLWFPIITRLNHNVVGEVNVYSPRCAPTNATNCDSRVWFVVCLYASKPGFNIQFRLDPRNSGHLSLFRFP